MRLRLNVPRIWLNPACWQAELLRVEQRKVVVASRLPVPDLKA